MNFIKCPKCGKEEPAFDYAHVCGPIQVKKPFNKLLREFEKESKLEIFGLGARRDIWEKALEKYAELIVKECARVARATPAPNFHEHLKQQLGHTWDMAASEAGREIVKHFGVEE